MSHKHTHYNYNCKFYSLVIPHFSGYCYDPKLCAHKPNRRFQDPSGHGILPADIHTKEWKRVTSVDFGVPLTVCSSDIGRSPPDLDLITPNQHIIHFTIMRWIISSLCNLYRLAELDPFPIEMESPEFIPTGGDIWKPWHHVYSLTKVGKGQTHRPVPNPYGKYIVRLFYLGSWRRITVDDYIPVDSDGRILLPCSDIPGELWPMILTKALLKVAFLTCGYQNKDFEMTFVTCLTAWLPIVLDLKHIRPLHQYLWLLCQLLTKEPADNVQKLDDLAGATQTEDNEIGDTTEKMHKFLGKVSILASLDEVTDRRLSGIAPCPSHHVVITDAKIITYGGDKDRPETPRWKRLRWKDWAIRTGRIEYVPIAHVKSVKLLSPFKQLGKDKETELRTKISGPLNLEEEFLHSNEDTKRSKQKSSVPKVSSKRNLILNESKSKSDANLSGVRSGRIRDFSEKKTRIKTKKLGDENSTNKIDESKEPAKTAFTWCDIEALSEYFLNVIIYLRISTFAFALKIPVINIKSPVRVEKINKKSGKVQAQSSNNQVIMQGDIKANEFYLFSDTISTKWMFITLCILPDCESSQEYSENMAEDVNVKNYIETGYMVCQKYDWRHDVMVETLFTIEVQNTNTAVIKLDEGLQVLKIWTKLPTCFSIIITSQTSFKFVSLQQLQELMSYRSASLSYYAVKICEAFESVIELASGLDLNESIINSFRNSYIPIHVLQNKEYAFRNLLVVFHQAFEYATVKYLFQKSSDKTEIISILTHLQGLLKNPEFGVKALEAMEKLSGISTEEHNSRMTSSSSSVSHKNNHYSKSGAQLSYLKSLSTELTQEMSGSTSSTLSLLKLGHMFLTEDVSASEILKLMTRLYPELLIHYPFRKDLELELSFADYMGEISISEGQDWVLFIRFILNMHEEHQAFTSLTLSVPVCRYVYRIIDNDSKKDMSKVFSNTIQDTFHHNVSGYTLLAYAKVEHLEEKEMKWKLRIMSSAEEELLHSCFWNEVGQCAPESPPSLTIRELWGYYIPNKRDIVFRAIVHSKKKQVLTIRVTLSKPEAHARLSVNSPDGVVVCSTESTGTLIIPVLWMDSSGNHYVVDVSVTRDSWPLTQDEQIAVHNMSMKERVSQDGHQKNSRRRGSSGRNSKAATGAPSWRMQVVADADKVDGLSLLFDNRPQEALSAMKRSWEQDEPGRTSRALGIRQDFVSHRPDELTLSSVLEKYGEGEGGRGRLVKDLLASQEEHMRTKAQEWEAERQVLMDQLDGISRSQISRHEAVARFTDRLQQQSRALLAEKVHPLGQLKNNGQGK